MHRRVTAAGKIKKRKNIKERVLGGDMVESTRHSYFLYFFCTNFSTLSNFKFTLMGKFKSNYFKNSNIKLPYIKKSKKKVCV